MISTKPFTDQGNRKAVKLMWDGQEVEGLTLRSSNGAKASITMNMGLATNSLGGGASNCSQKEYDALNLARDMIKKSIVTRDPSPDIQPVLEDAGWEVFPK